MLERWFNRRWVTGMAEKIVENGVDRSTEAKDLAADAKEAAGRGEKDESAFLADAARQLDPAAADEVLKGK